MSHGGKTNPLLQLAFANRLGLSAGILILLSTFGAGCGADAIGDPRALEACTPDCATSQCGADGCGGSCGTCQEGQLCDSRGTCYDPGKCTPDCLGRACGGDGCGGSCGNCAADELCNGAGACYAPNQCTPVCAGAECGGDGCGGSCGNCAAGELCDALGLCYDPATCIPDCEAKECGDDGCGANCGTCSGGDSCNQISGLCVAPVGLIWTDSIQTGGRQYGFDGVETERPVGNPVSPSDSSGVNLSRVPDPLGGPGYAMRQYGVYDEGGARSELGIWSFNQQAFRDLALSGEPVYVAQEIYFPEAVDAGGDGWAWLSLLDWHTTKDGGNRWDTSPGMMVKQDGSMRFQFAWRNVNDNSEWSTIALPVGEWFDMEMRWQFATGPTATVSVWINGQLALEQTGVVTAGQGNNVVEFYVKLYGSDQGRTPWSPVGISKYVRNVRISGEQIWR